ncbi:MAG: class I SAM-dependent rRNA methyltransferase, partial [Duncaniella sp.]|nr:class I SAM-dependent rRNA methyltransferase [Duncaniella sp.]
MKTIILKRGKEESLQRFHPWIFSGAIASKPDDLVEGDTVEVRSASGELMGTGHYEAGSIAVRMLTMDDTPVDDEFFSRRLAEAWDMRRRLGLITTENTTFRLVHGEGDFLPGCVVDVYGHTAVLQAHSPGMHFARHTIARDLVALPDAGIENVYYKSETTLPFNAALDPVNDYIIGKYDTDVTLENGLKFHVDWLKGQKTGFFIDQRENRALLRRLSKGAKVLNMFCYTGGFSVYALDGGAASVDSVDSSAKAITLTDANVALNFPGDTRHRSFAVDAFDFLRDMDIDTYDLIVLDPPAFAKHRGAIRNAMIGYRRLNEAAIAKIKPGGIIFTFSCSQAITKEQFRTAV